ncbi:hypothetical protein Agub_g8050 [Astrephomene gubernaculifera]|uniref:Staygreen protein domain-containing protein n=1 Tax=Astrephomene gubernaculifera TaxID=47775 RepID=A0AAD3HMU0_9CHLO|nr:hypothetical protein Agub_g8050 [Astrephomene gubernaculifera]
MSRSCTQGLVASNATALRPVCGGISRTHKEPVEHANLRATSHYYASTSQCAVSSMSRPRRQCSRASRRRVATRALFDPPPFRPEKLAVMLAAGTTVHEPAPPLSRKYTLTHNDITGSLRLTIGSDYNEKQISGFYTRLLRDEIVAEWVNIGSSGFALHVYCHVSGEERWLAPPLLRNYIFRRELPLVLDTLVYADRQLLAAQPELSRAQVYVHFQSKVKELDTVEYWGVLGDRGTWRKGPTSILLRLIYAVVGWPPSLEPQPADLSVDQPAVRRDVEAAVRQQQQQLQQQRLSWEQQRLGQEQQLLPVLPLVAQAAAGDQEQGQGQDDLRLTQQGWQQGLAPGLVARVALAPLEQQQQQRDQQWQGQQQQGRPSGQGAGNPGAVCVPPDTPLTAAPAAAMRQVGGGVARTTIGTGIRMPAAGEATPPSPLEEPLPSLAGLVRCRQQQPGGGLGVVRIEGDGGGGGLGSNRWLREDGLSLNSNGHRNSCGNGGSGGSGSGSCNGNGLASSYSSSNGDGAPCVLVPRNSAHISCSSQVSGNGIGLRSQLQPGGCSNAELRPGEANSLRTNHGNGSSGSNGYRTSCAAYANVPTPATAAAAAPHAADQNDLRPHAAAAAAAQSEFHDDQQQHQHPQAPLRQEQDQWQRPACMHVDGVEEEVAGALGVAVGVDSEHQLQQQQSPLASLPAPLLPACRPHRPPTTNSPRQVVANGVSCGRQEQPVGERQQQRQRGEEEEGGNEVQQLNREAVEPSCASRLQLVVDRGPPELVSAAVGAGVVVAGGVVAAVMGHPS